jgi:predicted dehydrogenase
VRRRPGGDIHTFEAGGPAPGDPVGIETEDFGSILLEFASGTVGAFNVSQVSPGSKNRLFFEIDAAKAALRWDQEDPNRLWLGRRHAPNEEIVRDPSLLVPEAASLAHLPGGHQEGWPDALKNLLLDFYSVVGASPSEAGRRPSFATFADAHRVMELVEAILASHRSGSWTDVPVTHKVRS